MCRRMCDKCILQLINVTLSVPPSGIQYALPHCIFKQPPSPPPAEVATLASALAANCQLPTANCRLPIGNLASSIDLAMPREREILPVAGGVAITMLRRQRKKTRKILKCFVDLLSQIESTILIHFNCPQTLELLSIKGLLLLSIRKSAIIKGCPHKGGVRYESLRIMTNRFIYIKENEHLK